MEQSQGPGEVLYFPHVFHRMSDTQYRQVKAALTETFVTGNAAVTGWSLGLNHPVGTVFKIRGGIGVDMVMVDPVNFTLGVFRYP